MEGVNSRKKRKVHLSEFYRFRLLFEIRYTHASAERHDSVRMLRVRNLMCKCNLTVSSTITATLNLVALSLAITLTFLRNPSFHICSSEHWSRLASSVLGCYAHSEMEVYSPYIPPTQAPYIRDPTILFEAKQTRTVTVFLPVWFRTLIPCCALYLHWRCFFCFVF